jgi:type IV fimbrial biogenesis protein FimT
MLLSNMNAKQAGFTLLELMLTIALLAVVMGFGVPNMQEFVRNARMSTSANDIITDFNYARSEAVKRRVPVTLCKSQNGTACDADSAAGPFNRWVIFVDDADPALVQANDGNGTINTGDVILRDRTLPDSITVTTIAGQTRATFLPTGFPRIETANVNRFVLCDVRGNVTSVGGDSTARAVEVTPTGRPSVFRAKTTITAYGGCP